MSRLTVTLCGSLTRAAHDLARVHRALALGGHLVHAPVPALPGEPAITAEQRANLDQRHRAAIDRSDLVIAVRWPGDHSQAELHYAGHRDIPIRWATTDADIHALLADIAADRLTAQEVAT